MKKRMIHISPVENRESILKEGLKLNAEGMLFLTEPLDVQYPYFIKHLKDGNVTIEAHWIGLDRLIAWKELFLTEYDVWVVEVDAEKLEADDVAEWEARWNHIYREPIKNPFLAVKGRKIDSSKPWVG